MKRYAITIDGHTFDVRLLSDPQESQVQVEVDGEALLVEVETVAADEAPAPAAATPVASEPQTGVDAFPAHQPNTSSGKTVVAPLPGVIKSIAVRPEQQVSPGDELLVIEAMKMDNLIRATRAGMVESILVVEGYHVDHGQPMVQYYE
jgi:biotin carboxyl carrier protein